MNPSTSCDKNSVDHSQFHDSQKIENPCQLESFERDFDSENHQVEGSTNRTGKEFLTQIKLPVVYESINSHEINLEAKHSRQKDKLESESRDNREHFNMHIPSYAKRIQDAEALSSFKSINMPIGAKDSNNTNKQTEPPLNPDFNFKPKGILGSSGGFRDKQANSMYHNDKNVSFKDIGVGPHQSITNNDIRKNSVESDGKNGLQAELSPIDMISPKRCTFSQSELLNQVVLQPIHTTKVGLSCIEEVKDTYIENESKIYDNQETKALYDKTPPNSSENQQGYKTPIKSHIWKKLANAVMPGKKLVSSQFNSRVTATSSTSIPKSRAGRANVVTNTHLNPSHQYLPVENDKGIDIVWNEIENLEKKIQNTKYMEYILGSKSIVYLEDFRMVINKHGYFGFFTEPEIDDIITTIRLEKDKLNSLISRVSWFLKVANNYRSEQIHLHNNSTKVNTMKSIQDINNYDTTSLIDSKSKKAIDCPEPKNNIPAFEKLKSTIVSGLLGRKHCSPEKYVKNSSIECLRNLRPPSIQNIVGSGERKTSIERNS